MTDTTINVVIILIDGAELLKFFEVVAITTLILTASFHQRVTSLEDL